MLEGGIRRMLCWISIFGGLLIMMGQHARSEALFYYFRLEDQVPEHHLLRLIDKHISFEFVRERLKDSYSDTGRPSIDPELLLRILRDARERRLDVWALAVDHLLQIEAGLDLCCPRRSDEFQIVVVNGRRGLAHH